MKRRSVVFLIFILMAVLAVSVFLKGIPFLNGTRPPDDNSTEIAGGVTVTPDVSQPDGVALSFLDAWERLDYETMYGYLSTVSQADYTLEEFTDIYTDIMSTMRLVNLEVAEQALVTSPEGDTAQMAYHVVYHTLILGPIERDLTMYLERTEDGWEVIWRPSMIFEELTGGSTLSLQVETPSRANIYDRNGQWMVAANQTAVTIAVVPGEIGETYEEAMLDLLSQILRMTPDEIYNQYATAPPNQLIALGDVDLETYQEYRFKLDTYPPIIISDEKTGIGRRYFNGLAPHVLGYTSFIQENQLETYKQLGYDGDEVVGQSGLELWGEQYLAGVRGGQLRVWLPDGTLLPTPIASKDPQPAQSIYTTLDRDLQGIVQDAVEDAYRESGETWAKTAGGASVVVMDVNNGDILAMYSYPSFDPNIFNPYNNHPLNTSVYLSELFNSSLRPLLNRSTQGVYPPGSIFKIVSTAAGLSSNLFTADSSYTCTGTWNELGNIVRRDWLEGGHGTLTLRQGLTASCNPWFYHIGLALGREDNFLLSNYAREFGFGSALGLIIDEDTGLIPDPDWKESDSGEAWSLEDSINMAIGQGNVLVNPLQVAVMVSAIANDGTVYQPQFVDKVGLIGEAPSLIVEPVVLGTLSVPKDHLETIRQSMRAVASDPNIGTASFQLRGLQVNVAGKTGTAEAPSGQPHAWFAGFAPYEAPELAVVVLVENGGQGSAIASPIFRRIVENYYGLRENPFPAFWSDPDLYEPVRDANVGE